jgi:hypothetical protein
LDNGEYKCLKNPCCSKEYEHQELRVAETTDWYFAAGEVVVPIVLSELADVAREYPVIFVKNKPTVYALTGIEQGINAYVGKDGRWLATYIPAQLRSYPFGLTSVPHNPGEFVIVVDAEAPQLRSHSGSLLFEGGQPSYFLQKRINLLKVLQRAELFTYASVKAIQEAGLLKDQSLSVKKADQQMTQLKGLQVVDEQKLNQMHPNEFARLRKQGALALIYAHLLSLANLRQGAIAGKYPQLQQYKDEMISAMLKDDMVTFK